MRTGKFIMLSRLIKSGLAEACKRLQVTREELSDMTPPEFYLDWLNWLLLQCKAVAVWEDFYMAPTVNRKQYAALRRLKLGGVYKGKLMSNGVEM